MPRPVDPTLRERLIAAATVAFADGGYSGSTLDGIAARAGVTKGGLYFHFAGKEELFFAVLDHWREHRRKDLQVQAVGPDGAVLALRQFLAGYLAFHLREPAATHLLRVLTTELRGRFTSRLREDDRQEQRWFRARVRELLELGARDGTLWAEDPALTAFVLCGAVIGILAQWHGAPTDVEVHCDEELLAQQLVARLATGEARSQPGEDEFDFGRSRDT
ncbi:MAG TPA: TetR/AcrR family transcriptional regulator [Planctomycetes bacterium]|nr:TetR/AcrR family transcriptional regulator [Planctomycetota bacterium]